MRKFLLGFLAGVLALPAVSVIAAALGLFPVTAKATPAGWERYIAGLALDAAARRAPRMANPYPATDENLVAGMKTFRNACAGCHGDPASASDYGASFYPNVPQFSINPPRKPDWQLYWIIKNGVRFSGMSAWDGQWGARSEERMWKAALFLSRLDSLPPAVNAEWHKKPSD